MFFPLTLHLIHRNGAPMRLAFALLVTMLLSTIASACRIPVFRYALENWEPGTFEAIVVHTVPLTPQQTALVELLREHTNNGSDDRVNLRVTTWLRPTESASATEAVTEATTDEAFPALNPREQAIVETAEEPIILLRFPSARGPALAWSGPLTELSVEGLLNSPLRQQLVTRLLDGDSAVWILVECGDAQRDNAAAELIEAELRRLEKTIELPALEELAAEEEFQANTSVPLRLGFSLVRLAPNDADEEVLRSMLLASEPDLTDFDDPIVIPVYGRGRTYYALIGKGINPELIEDNGRFVCGDCSCQIKDQNPGVDLLLAANWEKKVQGSSLSERDLPEVAGIGSLGLIDLGTVDAPPADGVALEGEKVSPTGDNPPHATEASNPAASGSETLNSRDDPSHGTEPVDTADTTTNSISLALVLSLGAVALLTLFGSVFLLKR